MQPQYTNQRSEKLPTPDKTSANFEAKHFGQITIETLMSIEPGNDTRLEEAHPQQTDSTSSIVIEQLKNVHTTLCV